MREQVSLDLGIQTGNDDTPEAKVAKFPRLVCASLSRMKSRSRGFNQLAASARER